MEAKEMCSKGWGERCAAAKSKRCRCQCGGSNHGAKRTIEEGGNPADGAADLFNGIREIAILPIGARIITHFDYPGSFGRRATTHLMVFLLKNRKNLVVATERSDNPGMSITNAAEALHEMLRAEFGSDVIVVEHYPERGDPRDPIKESLSLVRIENGTAKWSPLTRDSLTELIVGTRAMAVA